MSVEVLPVRQKLFRWFYCPHPSFLISCGIHIHAQIVKIQEYINKYIILRYTIFYNYNIRTPTYFDPFLLGHPQGMYLITCLAFR